MHDEEQELGFINNDEKLNEIIKQKNKKITKEIFERSLETKML